MLVVVGEGGGGGTLAAFGSCVAVALGVTVGEGTPVASKVEVGAGVAHALSNVRASKERNERVGFRMSNSFHPAIIPLKCVSGIRAV
jgi:hypothetical protein